MNGPAYTRLFARVTDDPERIHLRGGGTGDHLHPRAWTLAIIGGVVAITRRPHLFIFNAVKAVLAGGDPEQVYCNYETRFFPHAPEQADLDWFSSNLVGEMGQMRERTRSARLWKDVEVDESGTCAVVSFWTGKASVSAEDIALIVRAMDPAGPVWAEFIDDAGRYLVGEG